MRMISNALTYAHLHMSHILGSHCKAFICLLRKKFTHIHMSVIREACSHSPTLLTFTRPRNSINMPFPQHENYRCFLSLHNQLRLPVRNHLCPLTSRYPPPIHYNIKHLIDNHRSTMPSIKDLGKKAKASMSRRSGRRDRDDPQEGSSSRPAPSSSSDALRQNLERSGLIRGRSREERPAGSDHPRFYHRRERGVEGQKSHERFTRRNEEMLMTGYRPSSAERPHSADPSVAIRDFGLRGRAPPEQQQQRGDEQRGRQMISSGTRQRGASQTSSSRARHASQRGSAPQRSSSSRARHASQSGSAPQRSSSSRGREASQSTSALQRSSSSQRRYDNSRRDYERRRG